MRRCRAEGQRSRGWRDAATSPGIREDLRYRGAVAVPGAVTMLQYIG
jgi:hypothetical protein